MEIQVWTLIGVVIAGGGVATSLLLHAVGSLGGRIGSLGGRIGSLGGRIDSLERRIESVERRINGLDSRVDALGIRIDGLVAEVGHVNLTLDELVGKAHTHDRVA
ncbi:MAG TPA: hypothetical protein VG205_03195 [Acidimicrobiales bacterium]|nr:hypothetical protein [Acidimicrobiales bacterium]